LEGALLCSITLNLKSKLKLIVSEASPASFYLVLSIFVAGFLTASINQYSGDDGFYLAKAAYYIDHPDAIINK